MHHRDTHIWVDLEPVSPWLPHLIGCSLKLEQAILESYGGRAEEVQRLKEQYHEAKSRCATLSEEVRHLQEELGAAQRAAKKWASSQVRDRVGSVVALAEDAASLREQYDEQRAKYLEEHRQLLDLSRAYRTLSIELAESEQRYKDLAESQDGRGWRVELRAEVARRTEELQGELDQTTAELGEYQGQVQLLVDQLEALSATEGEQGKVIADLTKQVRFVYIYLLYLYTSRQQQEEQHNDVGPTFPDNLLCVSRINQTQNLSRSIARYRSYKESTFGKPLSDITWDSPGPQEDTEASFWDGWHRSTRHDKVAHMLKLLHHESKGNKATAVDCLAALLQHHRMEPLLASSCFQVFNKKRVAFLEGTLFNIKCMLRALKERDGRIERDQRYIILAAMSQCELDFVRAEGDRAQGAGVEEGEGKEGEGDSDMSEVPDMLDPGPFKAWLRRECGVTTALDTAHAMRQEVGEITFQGNLDVGIDLRPTRKRRADAFDQTEEGRAVSHHVPSMFPLQYDGCNY